MDVKAITKEQKNSQGNGYMFRGIDDVMNYMQPIMAKHNIFVVPRVISSEREERKSRSNSTLIYTILKVEYVFYAEDGTYFSAITSGEAMDSGDKSSNKAMSAAYKYAIFQVFSIPTEDMTDADATTPEESSPVHYCESCKKIFEDRTDKTGKVWSAFEIYQDAVARANAGDGVVRCLSCIKKMEKEGA